MSTLDYKKNCGIVVATETRLDTVMEHVKTYEWDSNDTKKALIDSRLDELGVECARLLERMREVEIAMASLLEQRKQLGE